MTKDEAMLYMFLYRQRLVDAVGDLDSDIEAYDIAIKALARDTPKKVDIEKWIATECPNGCGHILSTHHGDGYYSIDDKPTFCPSCGQRLDWGEEEEDDEE